MQPINVSSNAIEVFEANNEVDEVRWVTQPEADALLTYDRDRDLVRRFER